MHSSTNKGKKNYLTNFLNMQNNNIRFLGAEIDLLCLLVLLENLSGIGGEVLLASAER